METRRNVLLDRGIIIVLVGGHKDSVRRIYHGCMAVFNRIARDEDQHAGRRPLCLEAGKHYLSYEPLVSSTLFRCLCARSSFIFSRQNEDGEEDRPLMTEDDDIPLCWMLLFLNSLLQEDGEIRD